MTKAENEEEVFAAMLGGMANSDAATAAAAAAGSLAGLEGLANGILSAEEDTRRGGGGDKGLGCGLGSGSGLVGDSQHSGRGDKVDIIEATESALDLNRYMASVRSCGAGGTELASLTSSVDKSQGFPLLGESLAAHGSLVEGALHRICATIRQRWKVARIALVVRLGSVGEGELSLIIAVAANRWRDAIEAAQYASIEIKDKLAASIAPQCLGKEPKAAAALAAVAAAAGKTTADILGGAVGGGVGPASECGEPAGLATPDDGGSALKA